MSSHLKQKKVLPYVLCVEGNIGSGKSTLLKKLSESGFTVIPEPINDIWGMYLPRLYKDLKRWGFAFQMEAMDWFRQLQSKKFEDLLRKMKQSQNNEKNQESKEEEDNENNQDEDIENDKENVGNYINNDRKRERRHRLSLCSSFSNSLNCSNNSNHSKYSFSSQTELEKKVIIVERSALSAITIFAKNLLDTGFMTEWEYSLLQRFYSMIAWEPGHILYLRVDPEICCSRIQKRNRDGENNVNSTLITNLHNKHEIMFNNDDNDRNKIYKANIIIVDGTKDSNSVLSEALEKISNLGSK